MQPQVTAENGTKLSNNSKDSLKLFVFLLNFLLPFAERLICDIETEPFYRLASSVSLAEEKDDLISEECF